MKSRWDAGQFKLKGRKEKFLSCKCCIIQDFRQEYKEKIMKKEIEHTIETCLECNKPARWIRSTQFAGEHPYCEEHARLEKDFKQEDSYTYWYNPKYGEGMEDSGK